MNRTVEKGKTLLVDGPASVAVSSGKIGVFGSTIATTGKIVIREGKRLPFAVEEKADFNISLGEGAGVEETDGHTVPPSWENASEELMQLEKKPVTALVLGSVDSGKTSLCTYLVNRFLIGKRKIAVLDGDLGQSDIGPPCTVAYTFVTKPVTDLFNLTAKNAVFLGVTSPSTAINRVIAGLTSLKEEILNANPDVLIINTDGWIEGEDAIYYKIKLVEELNPDLVLGIQQADELTPILNSLGKIRKATIEPPPAIKQRTREKRKNLREDGYVKYMKKARVQSLPLNWLKVEEDETFGLSKKFEDLRKTQKLYNLLGMKPLSLLELPDKINVVIGKNRWIDSANVNAIEEFAKKKLVILRKGEEEGLLTGLYDAKRKFLGIGVLREIDFLRKTIKILTPVSGEISTIALGKVKLDKNMREIPAIGEDDQVDFKSFQKI